MFSNHFYRRFLALCLLCLSVGSSFTTAHALTDKIVAIVNDEVITQSEVQKQVNEQKQQMMRANVSPPSDQELRNKVLESLVERTLVLQLAERNKFKVSDQEIDGIIADVAKRNHISVAQLRQELQKIGIQFKDYRKKIAEETTIHHVQQQVVAGKVSVSDQDIDNYMHKAKKFNEAATARVYHIADILLPIAENASSQDKQAAQQAASAVIDRLQKGENPQQIIKTIKVNGKTLSFTDLGMRHLNEFPDIFVAPVANLKSGDVAGPIVAPNGLHVIKALKVQSVGGAKAPSFTREDARQMALQHKFEEALKPWMQQLRTTAYIKIND